MQYVTFPSICSFWKCEMNDLTNFMLPKIECLTLHELQRWIILRESSKDYLYHSQDKETKAHSKKFPFPIYTILYLYTYFYLKIQKMILLHVVIGICAIFSKVWPYRS
jgi:hypothetical protein